MRSERTLRTLRRRALATVGVAAATALTSGAGAALAASPGTPTSSPASLPAGTRLFGAAAQSNGDIVAVGESGAGTAAQLLVARFTPSGSLDGSFGSGGLVTGPAAGGSPGSVGRAVAVQSDGKIVVVGTASDKSGSARQGLLVERFNSNGSRDTGFGSGGVDDMLTTSSGDGYAVAIQPDGKIVVGGQDTPSATPYSVLVRLNSNGSADSSFGTGGVDILTLGSYSIVQSLAVQGNGSIVLAGSQSPGGQSVNALIARVNSGGGLDSSFAGTGAYAHQYSVGGAESSFNSVFLQSDGKIVAVGTATGGNSNAFALAARFNTNGSPDSSFGSGGAAYATAAANWLEGSNSLVPGASAGAIAGNGDIIAAGQYASGVLTYGTLWAFTPSGKLDTSFGSNGSAVLNSGNASEFGGLAVSPVTGDLGAVGDTSNVGGHGYAGTAVQYVGYGTAHIVTPPSTALKLTVSNIKASYKSGTLKVKVACNQACKLSLKLGGGSGLARQLKLPTLVRKCQKHHGHRRCQKVTEYKAVNVASASTTFGKARSQTFTLRLSKGAVKGLHKQRSVKMTLTVKATSTSTHKSVTFKKSVKFAR